MKSRTASRKIIIGWLVIIIVISTITIANADRVMGKFTTGNVSYFIVAGPISNSAHSELVALIKQWDDQTTGITMSSGSSSNARLKIRYCLEAPMQSGLLGQTTVYSADGTQVRFEGSWDKAECIVFNESAANETNRKATLVHEVGHALSLDHPRLLANKSIMRQGLKDFTTITAYDKSEIKAIWG